MNTVNANAREHIGPIILILLACLFILWPLLKPGFFISDDGEWMIIRLSAFYQSLAEGQFPVRFLGRLNYSYGYPVANFLYPGFLYIGSVLHFLGLSFVDAVKVILAGSVIGGAFLIYAWLGLEFSIGPSFIGAIGFLFAPYLVFDLYQRGSVGEILAFLPGALGLYSIGSSSSWLFPLAVGFLLVSHNSLALLFILLFAAYIAVTRQIKLIFPFLIGIGLSAFFWLPALSERNLVIFDMLKIANSANYFVGKNNMILLGFPGLAVVFLVFYKWKTVSSLTKFFAVIFVVSIFFATVPSSFLWQILPLPSLIQFPYRFLALGVVVAPWFMAASFALMAQQFRQKLIILYSLLIILPIIPLLGHITIVNRSFGFYTTNEATTTVADEYMPRGISIKASSHAFERAVFYAGRGTIKPVKINTQTVDVVVHTQEKSIIQINSIYYPGWGISIDGRPADIEHENAAGLMRVAISPGTHHLVAQFRETVSRFMADIISGISLVMYVWYVWHQKHLRNN